MDFTDPLEGKPATIGTIAMICISNYPNIGISSQIMGQLRIHHRRQVFPDNLSDIQTNHLKQLSRSLLNLLSRANRIVRFCNT